MNDTSQKWKKKKTPHLPFNLFIDEIHSIGIKKKKKKQFMK